MTIASMGRFSRPRRAGGCCGTPDSLRRLVTILVAAAALVAASPRGAAQPQREPRAAPLEELAHLADTLDLAAKQRQAIRVAHDEARKVTVKARADIEVASIDLRRELERDQPDESKVVALIEQISKLEGRVRTARIVAWLRVKKQLTAEQREKLARIGNNRVGTGSLDPRAAQAELAEQARALAEQARALAERDRELSGRRLDLAAERRERAELEASRARLEAEGNAIDRELEELRRTQGGSFIDRELEELRRTQGGSSIDREIEELRRTQDGAAKDRAKLQIGGDPVARIFVDGKAVGVTPLEISLPAGAHVIEARWPGHQMLRRIQLLPGQQLSLQFAPPSR